MKRTRAKLKSNSGASMIIALLFLLLCLTIGAILLSAASASAGRLKTSRSSQQNYLTVSSASDLIRDKLSGFKFTGVEKSVYNSKGGTTTLPSPTYTYSSSDAFPMLVGNKAAQVFMVKSAFNPSGLMPSAVPLQIAASFSNVTANMTIQSDYSIKVVLSPNTTPTSYTMTLTIPAIVDSSTVIDISRYTVTESVNGVSAEVQYTITTTTHTVQVTWGGGVISLGG
jgi:hypothetical protein